jgi:hypothetical protein
MLTKARLFSIIFSGLILTLILTLASFGVVAAASSGQPGAGNNGPGEHNGDAWHPSPGWGKWENPPKDPGPQITSLDISRDPGQPGWAEQPKNPGNPHPGCPRYGCGNQKP